MKQMLKIFLNVSLLSCTLSIFAAEDLQPRDWRATVNEVVASRKFQASLAGAGATAILTAVYANREEIKKPLVETWEDVQQEWENAQNTSISRGTVARTALALAGVGAIGVAGKKFSDSVDKDQIRAYCVQKAQEAMNYFSSLSPAAKTGVVVGTAGVVGATAYGVIKAYKTYRQANDTELTPLQVLRDSLSENLLTDLAIEEVDADTLFAIAEEQPVILMSENKFYNKLDESQKILVGLVIQTHETKNFLNND